MDAAKRVCTQSGEWPLEIRKENSNKQGHSHVRQINKGLPNKESRVQGIIDGGKVLDNIRIENHFSPDNMAVMDRISLEQLCEHDAISILPSCGSNGNSDITDPKSVKLPSSSRAAR